MTNFPAGQLLNMCIKNGTDLNPTRSLQLKVGAPVNLQNLKDEVSSTFLKFAITKAFDFQD